jgi:hypothetical protein
MTTSTLVSFSIIQQSTGGGERVVLEQGKFVFVLVGVLFLTCYCYTSFWLTLAPFYCRWWLVHDNGSGGSVFWVWHLGRQWPGLVLERGEFDFVS